ncbi:SDR family NAD(P)-dependent oxidoreductase, partial [Longimycelium tulufanense]|uniref:SDR family NAD(P)-dependent oxidoreductase n=1 Tax=Longimycelium tulufanense TaxID=907463 RepID=UPI001E61F161
VAEPVRFVDQIQAMHAAGARVFVEVGPGRVLTGLVGKILGDRPHTAVHCDEPGKQSPGLHQLLLALAELAAAGVPVDPLPLFAGRDAIPIQTPPTRPDWIVNGHLVRTGDGGYPTNALRPAQRITPPTGEAMAAANGDGGRTEHGKPVPPNRVPARATNTADPATKPRVAASREAAVLEYLRNARELIAAQRDVVLGLLGSTPTPGSPAVPATTAPVVSGMADAPAPRPAVDGEIAPPPEPEPEPAHEIPGPDRVRTSVLSVISARTGYPEDMLHTDLDLEADLSIDSIKRMEIVGELAEQLGSVADGTKLDRSIVEQMARIKTIGEIVTWICGHLHAGTQSPDRSPAESGDDQQDPLPEPGTPPAGHASGDPAVGGPREVPDPVQGAPRRHVVHLVDLPELPAPQPGSMRLAGERFVIVDDSSGVALELTDLLEQQGAQVRTLSEPDGRVDGLIHLAALHPGDDPTLPGAYGGIRDALLNGVRRLVLVTGSGGTFGHRFDGTGADDPTSGAGLHGLARTIAREFSEVLVRAVDIDRKDSPGSAALHILTELLADRNPVAVGYEGGRRRGLAVVPADPVDSVPLALGADGVVLLTGGARGITARMALALARTTGCHLELVGRTALPTDEDPVLSRARDEGALRRVLVAQGVRTPAEIEATIRRIMAEREMRATLMALRDLAASVRYHAVDVRDPDAVHAVVEDIYARHGRLDGVIHGAGLLEDRLIRDKAPESFARVWRTKVDGARALASAVRPDVGFFVIFGSVSGVYGNRGQADYAAANDACDTLARVWRTRLRGRVLVADWGPWAGGGMVTPELAREYARLGIVLLEPDAAVTALLNEIAAGNETQVLFTGARE